MKLTIEFHGHQPTHATIVDVENPIGDWSNVIGVTVQGWDELFAIESLYNLLSKRFNGLPAKNAYSDSWFVSVEKAA